MYAEITNADTGEVYKTREQGRAIRRILQFQMPAPGANTAIGVSLGWSVTDAGGNKLPGGHPGKGLRLRRSRVQLGPGDRYRDWHAVPRRGVGDLPNGGQHRPEVLDASVSRNLITGSAELRITARDDRYVAAVLVTNARQTEVLARQAAGSTALGEAVDVTLDVTDVTSSEIVVLAVDYAGNMTGYLVNIGGGSGDAEDDASEYIYANDLFNDTWLAFKPDDAVNAKTVASGHVYAAEYIDGYVFTVDSNLRFCVSPLEELDNPLYIETLNLPSVVLDMAYNYADGKLYALCSGNYLYTIDPLMGETALVGVIPPAFRRSADLGLRHRWDLLRRDQQHLQLPPVHLYPGRGGLYRHRRPNPPVSVQATFSPWPMTTTPAFCTT